MASPRLVGATPRINRGVTLIELMVGLVIGLLAVLVISQTLTAAEGQRRTTTSGADAQVNGALALYTLQRDVQMAGYGLSIIRTGLGCSIRSKRWPTSDARPLVPVLITDGGITAPGSLARPDTVRVLASARASFSVPTRVNGNHPTSGAGSDAFVVDNNIGISSGDLLIAVPPAPSGTATCSLFRANGTLTATSVAHASGAGDVPAWNGSNQADLLSVFPTAGYPAGSYLINIGNGILLDRTYSISASALQMAEFDATAVNTATTRELFPQVVNMQAFYGKDQTGNGVVDVYDTVLPTTPAQWAQVLSIRIAVVARSNQFEKDIVTSVAPEWDLGSTPTVTGSRSCNTGSQCLDIDVSADLPNDWRRYRYKLFDTVIPVRNGVWGSF